MEVQEEHTQIMKGKRTKRPRQASPLALTMASTSSTTAEDGGSHNSGGGFDIPATTTSTTNSGEFTDRSTEEEEEEDMANCLILLARGGAETLKSPGKFTPTTNNPAGGGLYAYQCKTCDKCFPSFQALGGHRASHNKPNNKAINGEEKKKASPIKLMKEESDHREDSTNTTLSLQFPSRVSSRNNNKSRVHECSVCGAEFTSGQALGGHMRRHRAIAMATSSADHDQSASNTRPTLWSDDREPQEGKKSRNVLALDLNLPAPGEDDHQRESKFAFASKKQVIVFSASPLVDCHY